MTWGYRYGSYAQAPSSACRRLLSIFCEEAIFAYTDPVGNLGAAQKMERLNTHTKQTVDSLDQFYKLLTHLQINENLAARASSKG